MFESAILSCHPRTKRFWTTCAGLTGEALLVACAVLAPMVWPQILPRAMVITTLAAPGPPPPPWRPAGPSPKAPTHTVAKLFIDHQLHEPRTIPPTVATFVDPAPEPPNYGVAGGAAGGDKNGVPGGFLDTIMDSGARPAPVVRPPDPAPATVKPVATASKPLRMSVVEMARPIQRVEPVYPEMARRMRVSGIVELVGVIGTDGRIHELKVLRGHPLLAKAAADAVRQWVYAPTMLNGQAVEVMAPITVTFHLN